MKFKVDTIANIIPKINDEYFLPALQREFVWAPDQICALFDSLLQGYPISTFLFWEIPKESTNQFEKYYFLKEIVKKGNRPIASNAKLYGKDLTFVLDGQQRLTSLYVGLVGDYRSARAKPLEKLHMDVFFHKSPDFDKGYKFKFEFRSTSGYSSASETKPSECWVSVNEIYQRRENNELEEKINEIYGYFGETDTVKREIVRSNLVKLHNVLFVDQVLAFQIERDSDQYKMLDIFMRVNNGGTELKKSELMLSTLILHWPRNEANQSAKQIVNKLVEDLNNYLGNKTRLDIDFVMKACLVLLKKPVAYDLKSFSASICVEIVREWDKITKALLATVKLVKSFGIDGDTLTSGNALLPIAFFLFSQRIPIVDLDRPIDDKLINLNNTIRVWLQGALINGIFSGTSDSTIHNLRSKLENSGCINGQFNIEALDSGARDSRENPIAHRDTIQFIFDNVNYKKKKSACLLVLLMLCDHKPWSYDNPHLDHLFPQKEWKKNNPSLTAGREHDIANLALSPPARNAQRGATPLHEWLEDKAEDYLKSNFIPTNKELWRVERYEDFITARKELMRERFLTIFNLE